MKFLESVARKIDSVNEIIGRSVAWLAVTMVLVQFAVVLMRYVFGISVLVMQESIVYMHALIFLIASGYTLLHNAHVRVDILYGDASEKKKALIDLVGVFVILFPVCGLVWVTSWSYVAASWAVLEGSVELSGIQAVYLLKTAILVFSALVALQGISMAVRSAFVLLGVYERTDTDAKAEDVAL